MVQIAGLPPMTSPAPRRAPARSTGFRLTGAGEAAATAESSCLPGVDLATMQQLLALQETLEMAQPSDAGMDAVRDREARRRGRALLDGMAGLQRGLLRGVPELSALTELAGLVAAPCEAADPGLCALLAEIRLRARIELARYGVL